MYVCTASGCAWRTRNRSQSTIMNHGEVMFNRLLPILFLAHCHRNMTDWLDLVLRVLVKLQIIPVRVSLQATGTWVACCKEHSWPAPEFMRPLEPNRRRVIDRWSSFKDFSWAKKFPGYRSTVSEKDGFDVNKRKTISSVGQHRGRRRDSVIFRTCDDGAMHIHSFRLFNQTAIWSQICLWSARDVLWIAVTAGGLYVLSTSCPILRFVCTR